MLAWEPDLYLVFEKQRTRPAIDLTAKIGHESPRRIIDIGCGPGNSTAVLKRRWKNAAIVGLDSSLAMLDKARESDPEIEWICADGAGDLSALGQFDIVFSNAAIHWMPDHATLIERYFGMLNMGGVLAVQMPHIEKMAVTIAMKKLVTSAQWAPFFTAHASDYHTHSPGYYYDLICTLSGEIDLWTTDYYHVMPSHTALVQWFVATFLRSYLVFLTEEWMRNEFLADFETALIDAYPIQKDGNIVCPFHRIFFTLKKESRK